MVLGIAGLGILAWGILLPSGAHAQFDANTAGNAGSSFGLAGGNAGSSNLITIIKSFINWILGLLSLIALVISLYGGFKMVTAAGDDAKYKDGFKILKQAAIGLIVIGLSWIFVSTIFWLIGGFAGSGTGTVAAGTKPVTP